MIIQPAYRIPDAVRPWQPVEVLASASRNSTTGTLYYEAPTWARGVQAMLHCTAYPGVDTINFRLNAAWEAATANYIVSSGATATPGLLWVYLGADAVPPYFTAGTQGALWPRIALNVLHSGAGAFTYRALLLWTP